MLCCQWNKYYCSICKFINKFNINLICKLFSRNKLLLIQKIHVKYVDVKMVQYHVQQHVRKMNKHVYLNKLKIQMIVTHGFHPNLDNVVVHVTRQKVYIYKLIIHFISIVFFLHYSRK
jgi:hypothetical protein